MTSISTHIEAPVLDPLLDIMSDATLSLGEKLLLIEALFAHDSTPEHCLTCDDDRSPAWVSGGA